MLYVSASNYREQMRGLLGGLCLSGKGKYLHVLSCVYSFTLAQKPRCQFIHRPWQHLRLVPENLANIPVSSQLFSSLFLPCFIELPGSAKQEEQMLHDEWFGAGVEMLSGNHFLDRAGRGPTTHHFLCRYASGVR